MNPKTASSRMDLFRENLVSKVLIPDKKDIGDCSSMGEGLKLELYSYQKEITKFCIERKNALIVAPCGAGK